MEQPDQDKQGTERAELEQQQLAELAERETAYGLFQRAGSLLKSRHHAQAAVLLERADRLEPGKGSIVEALARAYYNSGQHDRAEKSFRELLELDPSTPYGHFGLGQSLKQLGRREEARLHLRLAVALAPESAVYRNALTRLGKPTADKRTVEAAPNDDQPGDPPTAETPVDEPPAEAPNTDGPPAEEPPR